MDTVLKARTELYEEHERLKERYLALKKKDEETKKSEESYRKAFDEREEELAKTKEVLETLRRESTKLAEANRSLLEQHTQLQAEMVSASNTIQQLSELNEEVRREKDVALEYLEVLKRQMSSGSECGSVGRLSVVAEDEDEENVIEHEVQEVPPFVIINADDDEDEQVQKGLPGPPIGVQNGEVVTSEEPDTELETETEAEESEEGESVYETVDEASFSSSPFVESPRSGFAAESTSVRDREFVYGLDDKPSGALRPLDEELRRSGWIPGVLRPLRRRGEDEDGKSKEEARVLVDDGDDESSDVDGVGDDARRLLFKKSMRSPPRSVRKTLVEASTQYEPPEMVGVSFEDSTALVVPPVAAAAEGASVIPVTVTVEEAASEAEAMKKNATMEDKASAFKCSACGTRCHVQAMEKADVAVQIDAPQPVKLTLTDSSTQMDAESPKKLVETATQMEVPKLTDSSTETEVTETLSSSTQVEPVVVVESGTQAAASMVSSGTEMDVVEFSSSGVQVSATCVEFGTQSDEAICGTMRRPDSVIMASLTSDREGDEAVQCEGTQTFVETFCVQTQASSEVASFGVQVGTTPELQDSGVQAVAAADTVETQTIPPPEMCTAEVQVEAVVTSTATQHELEMTQAAVLTAVSVVERGVQALPEADDVEGVGVQVCPEVCAVEIQAQVDVVSASAQSEAVERRQFEVQTDDAVLVDGAVQTKLDADEVVGVASQTTPEVSAVATQVVVEVSTVAIQNVVETTQEETQACADVVEKDMQTQVDVEDVGGVAVQATPEMSSVAAEAVPSITEAMVQAIVDVFEADSQTVAADVADADVQADVVADSVEGGAEEVLHATEVDEAEDVVGDDHFPEERVHETVHDLVEKVLKIRDRKDGIVEQFAVCKTTMENLKDALQSRVALAVEVREQIGEVGEVVGEVKSALVEAKDAIAAQIEKQAELEEGICDMKFALTHYVVSSRRVEGDISDDVGEGGEVSSSDSAGEYEEEKTMTMDAVDGEVKDVKGEESVSDDHGASGGDEESSDGVDEDALAVGPLVYYTNMMRRRNVAAMYYFDETDDDYTDDDDYDADLDYQPRKVDWLFRFITKVLLLVLFGSMAIQYLFPMLGGRMITATRFDEFGRPIKQTYRTAGITTDENGWMIIEGDVW
ncbi:hypothetical protein HK102_005937, partial [Quaeritorhiza haematococci]